MKPDRIRRFQEVCRAHGTDKRQIEPHEEYHDAPLDWIIEKLGVERKTLVWSENPGYSDHDWDGDPDPFVQALDALANWQNVGIESATGTGKTFTLACITLWFLACWEDAIVVTGAPKRDQLLDRVWKEIERLWPRFQRHFPSARLMDTGEIRMRPGASRKWRAKAEVAQVRAGEKSATKAQGDHAEHMLIITEETPGIHPAIMTAFDNTRSAPHNLQISVGNPDYKEDPLHQFCLEPGVRHLRVSAYDHPNVVTGDHTVVPGAVSLTDVRRREHKYGHQKAFRKSRLRGISPDKAYGAAIQFRPSDHLESVSEEAIRELIHRQKAPVYCGIDFGSWRFAFVMAVVGRAGQVKVVREYFSQREHMETRARAIHRMLSSYRVPTKRCRIWGDAANPEQIHYLNRVFNDLRSPYRVRAYKREKNLRAASVEKINRLLGRDRLTFRRDLGQGREWRKGQTGRSDGQPMHGSRLLWEIKNWRYPEPNEQQAQKQDPDDDTADGADAVAALRYLIISYLRHAPTPREQEQRRREANPNIDSTDLEDVMRRQQKINEWKRARRNPHWWNW